MAQVVLGLGAIGAGAFMLWPNAPQHAREYTPTTPEQLAPPPVKGQSFSLKPDAGLPVRYAKSGLASEKLDTVTGIFDKVAATRGNDNALAFEAPGYPKDEAGTWTYLTWREYHQKSSAFAKAMINAGHNPFESTAICGFNNVAWHVAHMGTIMACGLSAGTYPTNSADACAFVASDSQAVVAAVDTLANAKKYLSKLAELPKLKRIVVWAEAVPADLQEQHKGLLLSFDEFLAEGSAVNAATLNERKAMQKVENAATLIYTSGTTGHPKAVMVSHDAMLYSAHVVLHVAELEFERMVSYLPLSHIAAQILDIFIPLLYCAKSADKPSCVVYFARPDVLKGSLPITLKSVRPNFFFGVPRVWEKFVEGIKAKARAAPATGAKKKLVDFAKDVGLRSSYARQTGGNGYIPRGHGVAAKLVHEKVREALGLDQCKLCLTAAAPIARDTLDFLAALGIDVGEVYGMSETCGMGSLSVPTYKFKFGSCGFVTPTMELKTDYVEGRDKPGEGEICFRGRHLMMGYMRNDGKTREAIDADGWMHSGDVGRIDDDGHVYITGRIKDLIIGAGGENIAPVPIEDEIKAACPALSNVVMIGNNRKYNVCLVTLKSRPNLDTGDFHDDLVAEALEVNPEVKTVTAAREDKKWQQTIQAALDKYNAAAVSNAQKIQKFVILPKDLSLAGDELTATLKLKRNVVEAKYAAEIDAMY